MCQCFCIHSCVLITLFDAMPLPWTRQGCIHSYLQEHGESLLVSGRAASGPRVLPVHVQPVQVVATQPADGAVGEGRGAGRVCYDGREL